MIETSNISLNSETLVLTKGESYLLIDALYLNEIKDSYELPKEMIDFKDVKDVCFPFNKIPFVIYFASEPQFSIKKIKKVSSNKGNEIDEHCFSTDTGLLIFVSLKILPRFLPLFNYDELTDSIIYPVNIEYWHMLTREFNSTNIALMLCAGINSGVDFDGSGAYKIV